MVAWFILKLSKLVGANIRESRMKLGFSQEKLSELADLHPTFIGKLERGEVNVSIWSLEKIASALKTKPYRLLMDEEE
jgi:transcriptional regulator with XRE-family HTH domain